MTTHGIVSAPTRSTAPLPQDRPALLTALLVCGLLASLLYAAMLILVPLQWPGYSSAAQTVSELSAIDAPTRPLWVALGRLWTLLVFAFGFGVWAAAPPSRPLRVAGTILVVYAITGLFWPPMHLREVLAAGGKTTTDCLHILWTIVSGFLMMLAIGFAATALGKGFRAYSIATLIVFLALGALTGRAGPRIEANLPTPWIGVWERIIIGGQMLWIAVLAIRLLRRTRHWTEVTLP